VIIKKHAWVIVTIGFVGDSENYPKSALSKKWVILLDVFGRVICGRPAMGGWQSVSSTP